MLFVDYSVQLAIRGHRTPVSVRCPLIAYGNPSPHYRLIDCRSADGRRRAGAGRLQLDDVNDDARTPLDERHDGAAWRAFGIPWRAIGVPWRAIGAHRPSQDEGRAEEEVEQIRPLHPGTVGRT